jgi:predicted PurR-regulated permease PerM
MLKGRFLSRLWRWHFTGFHRRFLDRLGRWLLSRLRRRILAWFGGCFLFLLLGYGDGFLLGLAAFF